MKDGADIHDPQSMNPNDFGEHVKLNLAPSTGENLDFFFSRNFMIYNNDRILTTLCSTLRAMLT